jgi:hypothetical protein
MATAENSEDYFTLLCVRADGVAPVVDLLLADDGRSIRTRALALLKEHASCEAVEVWRGAVLVERFRRD